MGGGMQMPGGWVMPMTWMRMPGQSWPGAAGSFLWMWMSMMAAMMLPSLLPALARYRGSVRGSDGTRLAALTALAAGGYFFVWGGIGAIAYPVGLALAAMEMRSQALSRIVPAAGGIAVLIAGSLQLTAWKARQLERCRADSICRGARPPGALTAWRHGLRLGGHCILCCAGYTMILFLAGLENLAAMTLIAAAITLERVAPRPRWIARASGALVMGGGVVTIARMLARA